MTQRFSVRHLISMVAIAVGGLGLLVATPAQAASAPSATNSVSIKTLSPTTLRDLRMMPVMSAAGSVLGHPYRWGGSAPGGFDCSGLVQWSFARAGMHVPRSSGAQRDATLPISAAQARSGDLVFFGNPTYHVGIYMGGGQMIHAPSSGKHVSIVPVHRFGISPSAYGRVK